MKTLLNVLVVTFLALTIQVNASDKIPATSHGISYPTGWQNWAAIAVSHRTDNNTLRLILGNDIAVKAARSGNTNPWPDNSIIGKIVWKDTKLKNWKAATAPGKFVHAEFMFKNSKKYTDSYGWGWARWVGMDQKPFEKGMRVCISCHTPVKNRDWVFTDSAEMP